MKIENARHLNSKELYERRKQAVMLYRKGMKRREIVVHVSYAPSQPHLDLSQTVWYVLPQIGIMGERHGTRRTRLLGGATVRILGQRSDDSYCNAPRFSRIRSRGDATTN